MKLLAGVISRFLKLATELLLGSGVALFTSSWKVQFLFILYVICCIMIHNRGR